MFAHGETVTRLRWWTWGPDGTGEGYPDERVLAGVALAPAADASDPAGRRGHIKPAGQLLSLGAPNLDVEPHDLLQRPDHRLWAVTAAPQRWSHPMTGRPMGATADVTELVDEGPHTVTIRISAVQTPDVYGMPVRTATGPGVQVSGVTVEPQDSPENSTDGQSAPARFRVTGRGLEALDAWSQVEWMGRVFEVVETPRRWPWPPAHPYTQAQLRERL